MSERHAGGKPPSEHADWVLGLGPGGGVNGGEIVAEGTPEIMVEVAASFTGHYLKPFLERFPRFSAETGVEAAKPSKPRRLS